MKHNKFQHNKNQKTVSVSQDTEYRGPTQSGSGGESSADEATRRAFVSHVEECSLPGYDMQYWLEAEAQLLAEGRQTRDRGFEMSRSPKAK